VRRILVVGVGPGGPDQITVEALRALGRAQVIFELGRGTEELTAVRREICHRHLDHVPRVVAVEEPQRERHAADYAQAVERWRAQRAQAWKRAIARELPDGGCGAFLAWGDPSLYDSTLAVLEAVARELEIEVEVIPGVSSLHLLTARHRIPLNRVAGCVLITPGRRLLEGGWPDGVEDVVVMLDSQLAFRALDPTGVQIFWGAYLGTHDELLVAGPLQEVAAEIERLRARARVQKGWIMDLYLLRRG
jgi:precorrin-6A synthase